MEVCSWDWGAIGSFLGAGATLYAACIALSISNEWRNEKGSEVVANECKLILLELNKFVMDSELLFKISTNESEELLVQTTINQLTNDIMKIENHLQSVRDLLKNKEVNFGDFIMDVYIDIRRALIDYASLYKDKDKLLDESLKGEVELDNGEIELVPVNIYFSEVENIHHKISSRIDYVKKEIIPFIMYEKNLKKN